MSCHSVRYDTLDTLHTTHTWWTLIKIIRYFIHLIVHVTSVVALGYHPHYHQLASNDARNVQSS